MKEIYDVFPFIDKMDDENRTNSIDYFLNQNKDYFLRLPFMESEGIILNSIKFLDKHFDIYFLSTPHRHAPQSYGDKKIWLDTYIFGKLGISDKKLILSHNKHLNVGDYLIDDRKANGSEKFTGVHIHYGQSEYPTWSHVIKYFKDTYKIKE